jgi:hypothetical protein
MILSLEDVGISVDALWLMNTKTAGYAALVP